MFWNHIVLLNTLCEIWCEHVCLTSIIIFVGPVLFSHMTEITMVMFVKNSGQYWTRKTKFEPNTSRPDEPCKTDYTCIPCIYHIHHGHPISFTINNNSWLSIRRKKALLHQTNLPSLSQPSHPHWQVTTYVIFLTWEWGRAALIDTREDEIGDSCWKEKIVLNS